MAANINIEATKKAFNNIKQAAIEIETLTQDINLYKEDQKETFKGLISELKINPKSPEGKEEILGLKKALALYLSEDKKELHIMLDARDILTSITGTNYGEE